MGHPHQYDTANKQAVRDIALRLKDKRKKKPAKVFLCFPARECLDLKQALAAGKIDRNTLILAIERTNDKYYIHRFLSENFNYHFLCSDMSEIFGLMKKRTIDLAYIDICGCMTPEFVSLLRRLQPYLSKKCLVSLTTLHANRGCKAFVDEMAVPFTDEFLNNIPSNFHQFIDFELTDKTEETFDNAWKHASITSNALGFTTTNYKNQIIYRKGSDKRKNKLMIVNVWKR